MHGPAVGIPIFCNLGVFFVPRLLLLSLLLSFYVFLVGYQNPRSVSLPVVSSNRKSISLLYQLLCIGNMLVLNSQFFIVNHVAHLQLSFIL